ncbi:MAG TPA: DUF1543 domain-containing protein [Parachlamydiaceae bacterium]|nr:DUF1543 domain-containing protein [Parachlamydiaceae bacterium]
MNGLDGKKLFAVYLGGRADKCNIELHDVVFVVGSSIEETYPLLAKKWFGNLQGFHIDSYMELQHIDGYKIEVCKEHPKDKPLKKLYFINVGAYKTGEFTEYHQSEFYVAESSPEAIKRAMSELCKGMKTIHKDDVVVLDKVNHPLDFDVDDVLEIQEVDDYYISLKPSTSTKQMTPISAYLKLDFLKTK